MWSWTSHEDPHKPADEVVILRSDARQAACAAKAAKRGANSTLGAPFNPLAKAASLKNSVNASLSAWAASGLGAKPAVDPAAVAAAASSAKAGALWQANWTLAGVAKKFNASAIKLG